MEAIDTRNFVQIVQSLSKNENRELTLYLMKYLGVAEVTARCYKRGARVPDYCKQQVIVKGLNKLFGIKTNAQILFNGN